MENVIKPSFIQCNLSVKDQKKLKTDPAISDTYSLDTNSREVFFDNMNKLKETVEKEEKNKIEAGSWDRIKEEIKETSDNWEHEGKKLGILGGAVGGGAFLPVGLNALFPSAINLVFGPIGMLGCMALASIEESKLGIGKKLGGLIGKGLGAGVGTVKGAGKEMLGIKEENGEKVELPIKPPAGKGPKEPLLQSLLHKTQKKLLGKVPERTKSVELGENLATFLGPSAACWYLGSIATGIISGPIGVVIAGGTLMSLSGFVLANIEENFLGIGRTAGELAGLAIDKIISPFKKSNEKADDKNTEKIENTTTAGESKPKKKPGLLRKMGKIILDSLGVISAPMTSILIDSSKFANSLFFSEKPVQTMKFQERPAPEVNKERLVNNFTLIAGINGKYPNENNIGDEICRQFSRLKVDCTRDEIGNVIATIPGNVTDSPTVLLSAHMDTVKPTSAEAIKRSETRVFTDEKHILGADDRAGMAEIMEGLQVVLEKNLPHPDIKVIFTVGEEAGLVGSAYLTQNDVSTRPTLGFVVDALDAKTLNLTNDSVILQPSKSVKYRYSQEDPLVQVAMVSMANAGIKPEPIHAPILPGAGSDANIKAFNNNTIHSIAIGTGGRDVHSVMENIKINDLEQVAKSVVGFITNTCDLKVDENQNVVPRYSL